MKLTIDEHVIRTFIIKPQERIDAFNANELQQEIDRLTGLGINRFIIDLSLVPFLDSAGMAVLVRLLKLARQHGGDVMLTWPQEEARFCLTIHGGKWYTSELTIMKSERYLTCGVMN